MTEAAEEAREAAEEDLLVPFVIESSRGFWSATKRGELRIQECSDCHELRHPPRVMCPSCHSFDYSWRLMSGRGRIYSFIIAHPPLLPGYAQRAPYNAVLVELEESPKIRMVGNLVADQDGDIDEVGGEDIHIGDPVEVVFYDMTDEIALPRWRLLAG